MADMYDDDEILSDSEKVAKKLPKGFLEEDDNPGKTGSKRSSHSGWRGSRHSSGEESDNASRKNPRRAPSHSRGGSAFQIPDALIAESEAQQAQADTEVTAEIPAQEEPVVEKQAVEPEVAAPEATQTEVSEERVTEPEVIDAEVAEPDVPASEATVSDGTAPEVRDGDGELAVDDREPASDSLNEPYDWSSDSWGAVTPDDDAQSHSDSDAYVLSDSAQPEAPHPRSTEDEPSSTTSTGRESEYSGEEQDSTHNYGDEHFSGNLFAHETVQRAPMKNGLFPPKDDASPVEDPREEDLPAYEHRYAESVEPESNYAELSPSELDNPESNYSEPSYSDPTYEESSYAKTSPSEEYVVREDRHDEPYGSEVSDKEPPHSEATYMEHAQDEPLEEQPTEIPAEESDRSESEPHYVLDEPIISGDLDTRSQAHVAVGDHDQSEPKYSTEENHSQEASMNQPVPSWPTFHESAPQPQQFAAQSAPHVQDGVPQHVPPVQDPSQEKKKSRKGLGFVGATSLALVAGLIGGAAAGFGVYKYMDQDEANLTTTATSGTINQSGSAAKGGASSVEAVAAKVLPSVVSIEVYSQAAATGSFLDPFFGMEGLPEQQMSAEGSGSIISEDGAILTNNHVVAGLGTDVTIDVTLHDGRVFPADVVATDPSSDIAVIKLRGVSGLTPITFGDSNALQVGQPVVAVGSPLGLSATVTSGIVSALNRPISATGGDMTGLDQQAIINAVQTDAAINPGNSGGPLVDMSGALIGMNSVIASTGQSKETAGNIGLGFAIPSNYAKRTADQLLTKKKAVQPMLGVNILSSSDPRTVGIHGAPIAQVNPNTPGEAAGLQAGDVITKVNDTLIERSEDLLATIRSQDFGATVTLTVTDENGANERTVEVTLTGE